MGDQSDDHQGMEYMERIDAHIDSSIYSLIEFFLDRGYQTEYCCSGTFKDHYTEEEKETEEYASGDREIDSDQYSLEVSKPYISFSPIFHEHHGGNSTVDDTVYYLKEALSDYIDITIYSGERSDLEVESQQQVHYTFDIGTPYQGYPTADHTYTLDIEKLSLQKCFVDIDRNVDFYDDLLEAVFEVIKLAVDEPILGHHTTIHANREREEFSNMVDVRHLPDDIDTSELYIVNDTDVEDGDSSGTKPPRYKVCGLISTIREELYEKPDQEYIDSLYEESERDMDPFDHPNQPN